MTGTQEENNNAVDTVIDVEVMAWMSPFKRKLDEYFVPHWRGEPCSIFRVPPTLQIQDPEAYAPTVVSIGPYHWSSRNSKNLIEMEKRKHRVARRFFSRDDDSDAMAAKCFQKVKALEKRARSCYADDKIDTESQEFTEMMVLDGCFIIGLLLFLKGKRWVWVEGQNEEMEMFVKQEVPLIFEDLIKLENQIPFFILKTLYRSLMPQSGFKIEDLAVDLLRKLDPAGNLRLIKMDNPKAHHLLHLFYQILLYDDPKLPEEDTSDDDDLDIVKKKSRLRVRHHHKITVKQFSNFKTEVPQNKAPRKEKVSNWMRSAVELQEAGIKFKGKEDCSFLHVSFRDGGVLEIPTLSIFERTIPTFKNLIAFEQCYPLTGKHVTYYADLMDSLIDTSRDVNVLQDAGILKIGLNNQKEAAQLFNQLCRHVFYNNGKSYLGNVYQDVNHYCDSKCHRWRALLVREKFSNPWAIISLVAAFVLLVLTFLQTFYSMFSYHHPPSP